MTVPYLLNGLCLDHFSLIMKSPRLGITQQMNEVCNPAEPQLHVCLFDIKAFLSWLRLSIYMAIVSVAILITFHLKSEPTRAGMSSYGPRSLQVLTRSSQRRGHHYHSV